MTRPTKVAYLVVIPLLILAMVMLYNRFGERMKTYNILTTTPSPTVNPWLDGDSVQRPLQ